MSPDDLDLSLAVHRKRSSRDTADPPDFEAEKSPTKKVRFILDDNRSAATSASAVTADDKARTDIDENEPSSGAPSVYEASSEIPDLRLYEDLSTTAQPPASLTNTLNGQADPFPVPPPSPRPKALDGPVSNDQSKNQWTPTISTLTTACRSGTPSPDILYNDRPKLDEDLLVSQIEDFSGVETDRQNPNIAQAQKNVQAAKVAYQLADFALGVARDKKISVRGDAHMANIVSRAAARLRAATEKQKEIMAGGRDIPDLTDEEQVKSIDERDEKGNVWCLGMLGGSLRNHCCSDCESLARPYVDFVGHQYRSC